MSPEFTVRTVDVGRRGCVSVSYFCRILMRMSFRLDVLRTTSSRKDSIHSVNRGAGAVSEAKFSQE